MKEILNLIAKGMGLAQENNKKCEELGWIDKNIKELR